MKMYENSLAYLWMPSILLNKKMLVRDNEPAAYLMSLN